METHNNQLTTRNEDEAILKEFFTEVMNQLTAKGHQLAKMTAPLMLSKSSKVEESREECIRILISSCEVLFGLRAENLTPELWNVSFASICERFKGITISDIQNSFRYAVIEKKAYQTLTRDELLQPISEYWKNKVILLNEIDLIRQKNEKEIQSIREENMFRQKAKEIYLKSLEAGHWIGDEFHADAIARNFSECFSQEDKNEFMRCAKIEFAQRKKAAEDNQFELVPSWQKIFSRVFIEHCVKKRMKFIAV